MRLHRTSVRYRRRYLLIPILVMMIVPSLFFWVNTQNRLNIPNTNRDASLPSPLCHKGDPLAGVSNPEKFRIISNCELATGVVESNSSRHDDQLWIEVTVDSKYARLLGPENFGLRDGLLILEKQVADQVTVPSIGERVTFVGPLVYDTQNHFNAITPLWSLTQSEAPK